jgi:hypothetical protein
LEWKKLLAASSLSVILLQGTVISAREPTLYSPLKSVEFRPIIIPPIVEPLRIIKETRPPIIQVDPKPKVEIKSKPVVPVTSRSIRGKASWYCSVSKPICHYKYPPGSMVAAACGKLRRAMGGEAGKYWRGKTVRVETSKTNFVYVKLVDWCGSKDKTIDLYWAPMSKLGGTGVLDVRISW